MRLVVVLIFTLLSACADLKPDQASDRTGGVSSEKREALYQQASEAAQQSRERYIATERPALQRKFRQEYPTMADTDIEVLVTDALEKGLRSTHGRRPDGPVRQPPLDCMSSLWRNSPFMNCY
ncbi:hypothetical protein [Nitrospira sp. BLG_2]|uniref:hypothetical protein n=1 Tax=Nitrospira sp. BLG_2 TaxID=3397507 RepID=UPI003B9B25E3